MLYQERYHDIGPKLELEFTPLYIKLKSILNEFMGNFEVVDD